MNQFVHTQCAVRQPSAITTRIELPQQRLASKIYRERVRTDRGDFFMSRVCELTAVRPLAGNNVSHSNRKTRTRWTPNLKSKKYFIGELCQAYTFRLSTRAIRTIDKLGGIENAILSMQDEVLSEQMQKIKRALTKKRHAPVHT